MKFNNLTRVTNCFHLNYKVKGEVAHMKNKRYDALDVAKYVINYSTDELNIGVTNLKLQKLLYYIQAEFQIDRREPLFHEPIEAWRHGLVVRDVYAYFRGHMDKPIDNIYKPRATFKGNKELLINRVIERYKSADGWHLVKLTHQEDPWINAYNDGEGINAEITIESMIKYFVKQTTQKRWFLSESKLPI